MIYPDTELRFISSEIGFGVFATRFIPKGTITWALDELDQVFEPSAVAALSPRHRAVLEKYCYVDASGNHVLCWDLGRYMNHSCDPSARGIGYGFEVAVRDILPGEELTCDYASINITTSFQCACGSANCRQTVRPNDILLHWETWDNAFSEAFRLIRTVPQPLWEIAVVNNQKDEEIAKAIGDASINLPSCRDFYIPPEDIIASVSQSTTSELWQKQSQTNAAQFNFSMI